MSASDLFVAKTVSPSVKISRVAITACLVCTLCCDCAIITFALAVAACNNAVVVGVVVVAPLGVVGGVF